MRPNSKRAKFAIISLYAIIVGAFLYSLRSVATIYIINKSVNGGGITLNELESISIMSISTVVIHTSTYLVCTVLFILWFTRAYRNIQVLLPKSKFHYKPWAAVVCWFIPIWNLFGPYNIASNLFDKTERYLVNEERMNLRPQYDVVKGCWWALWIMSSIVIRMSQHYTEGNPFSFIGPIATLIGFSISILCAIFAVKMIRNYQEMETLILSSDGSAIDYKLSNDDLLDSGI